MRSLVAIAALLLLTGCESISYYGQAIGGHFKLLSAARPIDSWLADPATPADLRQHLETARGIRQFTTRELHLPDNASYTTYADLGRRFAVYNVFAAPKFSVDPKAACFPVTGCVAYRGFFAEKEAQQHADKLRAAGFDVYVGGVLAYSTLGWFDDPLLSTFIRYPDAQVARLVFHELAHSWSTRKATRPSTSPSRWWSRTRACGAGSKRRGGAPTLRHFVRRRSASAISPPASRTPVRA